MTAALKDVPAKAFRTPPGIRLYRVSPATGLAASGGQAIYEGYKPGTDPSTNRHLGLQHLPDEIPIRSSSEERPLTRLPAAAPATGTGGLY